MKTADTHPLVATFDESGRFVYLRLLARNESEETRLRPVGERLLARLLAMDIQPVGEA